MFGLNNLSNCPEEEGELSLCQSRLDRASPCHSRLALFWLVKVNWSLKCIWTIVTGMLLELMSLTTTCYKHGLRPRTSASLARPFNGFLCLAITNWNCLLMPARLSSGI